MDIVQQETISLMTLGVVFWAIEEPKPAAWSQRHSFMHAGQVGGK